MAYQKQTKVDNRRIWKFKGIDPEDGEPIYEIRPIKLKNKDFARPIILTAKLSYDYFLNEFFNQLN